MRTKKLTMWAVVVGAEVYPGSLSLTRVGAASYRSDAEREATDSEGTKKPKVWLARVTLEEVVKRVRQ